MTAKDKTKLYDYLKLTTPERYKLISTDLQRSHCDVICLQEVDDELYTYLSQNLPGYQLHFTKRKTRKEGVAVLVNVNVFKPIQVLAFEIGKDKAGIAVSCKHVSNKKEYSFFNIHLTGGQTPDKKNERHNVLNLILDRYANESGSNIISGDFNIKLGDTEYLTLIASNSFNYKDSWKDLYPDDDYKEIITFRTKDAASTVDYILYKGGGLKVDTTSTKSFRVAFPYMTSLWPHYPSDHVPTMVGFK